MTETRKEITNQICKDLVELAACGTLRALGNDDWRNELVWQFDRRLQVALKRNPIK